MLLCRLQPHLCCLLPGALLRGPATRSKETTQRPSPSPTVLRPPGHNLIANVIDSSRQAAEDGVLIRPGVSADLDDLRQAYDCLPDYLTQLVGPGAAEGCLGGACWMRVCRFLPVSRGCRRLVWPCPSGACTWCHAVPLSAPWPAHLMID